MVLVEKHQILVKWAIQEGPSANHVRKDSDDAASTNVHAPNSNHPPQPHLHPLILRSPNPPESVTTLEYATVTQNIHGNVLLGIKGEQDTCTRKLLNEMKVKRELRDTYLIGTANPNVRGVNFMFIWCVKCTPP